MTFRDAFVVLGVQQEVGHAAPSETPVTPLRGATRGRTTRAHCGENVGRRSRVGGASAPDAHGCA
jgi:hypothetical protein